MHTILNGIFIHLHIIQEEQQVISCVKSDLKGIVIISVANINYVKHCLIVLTFSSGVHSSVGYLQSLDRFLAFCFRSKCSICGVPKSHQEAGPFDWSVIRPELVHTRPCATIITQYRIRLVDK